MTRYLLILLLSLFAVACGGSEPAKTSGGTGGGDTSAAEEEEDSGLTIRQEYSADKGSATVTGTVKWNGKAPKRRTIDMGSDKYCEKCATDGNPYQSESTVVGPDGGLANVVISLKGGDLKKWKFGKGAATREIDQLNCRYIPHVIAVQQGDSLNIKNSDSTMHNIHATNAGGSDWFNQSQPNKGNVFETSADSAGVFKLKCDVHGWMISYIVVYKHPFFAVSGEDGKFSIGNVPAGTYTVVAWHEKHGEKEMSITVGDGESKDVSFQFEK